MSFDGLWLALMCLGRGSPSVDFRSRMTKSFGSSGERERCCFFVDDFFLLGQIGSDFLLVSLNKKSFDGEREWEQGREGEGENQKALASTKAQPDRGRASDHSTRHTEHQHYR